jgi:hypothetical protein
MSLLLDYKSILLITVTSISNERSCNRMYGVQIYAFFHQGEFDSEGCQYIFLAVTIMSVLRCLSLIPILFFLFLLLFTDHCGIVVSALASHSGCTKLKSQIAWQMFHAFSQFTNADCGIVS